MLQIRAKSKRHASLLVRVFILVLFAGLLTNALVLFKEHSSVKRVNYNASLTTILQEQVHVIDDSTIPVGMLDQRNEFRCDGLFTNRSAGLQYLCVILAGYKLYLKDVVYPRIQSFLPDWIDVCVVSAGLRSEELAAICKRNGWSYLSTKENNVCLIQNVAIDLHPQAKFIFKIDEDMFITEGFFTNMVAAYTHALGGPYVPGIIAPLIPINSYGSRRILDKFNLVEQFNSLFPTLHHGYNLTGPLFHNPNITLFFWGEGGFVPHIDELNKIAARSPMEERPSGIRFNIGAILFPRSTWKDMGYLKVDRKSIGMGADEWGMNLWCYMQSRPIMVSENIIIGHFCHSPQNNMMKAYMKDHPEAFALPGQMG